MSATLRSHPLYSTFVGIRQRCTCKSSRQYADYGGRGIAVHQSWLNNPWEFIRYVELNLGTKGSNDTIDRMNNNKGYEPGNIRWASRTLNARNKRSNRQLTLNGQTRCLAEWAEISGLTVTTIHSRLRRGWDVSSVLAPPKRKKTS